MLGLIFLGLLGGCALNIPNYAKNFRGASSTVRAVLDLGTLIYPTLYFGLNVWAFFVYPWWWVLIEIAAVYLLVVSLISFLLLWTWESIAAVICMIAGTAFTGFAIYFFLCE